MVYPYSTAARPSQEWTNLLGASSPKSAKEQIRAGCGLNGCELAYRVHEFSFGRVEAGVWRAR